ncbi:hypothetical protein GGR52DRAFT_527445 [Hypoxylon sp. FL1284]|nr:hypothetical protein GGR52DRAFT_527445 [Hypoxylon sp. FL1284]
MSSTDNIIKTEIGYFSRSPRYDTEKPYTTSFPVDHIPGAQHNNQEWVFHNTAVEDARDERPELDTQGFQYLEWKTNLSRPDFKLEENIKTRYYRELAEMIKRAFPRYKKLAFFDYGVRVRDGRYPNAQGVATEHTQPFRYAHADFSEKGARMRLMDSLGEGAAERLQEMKCDLLNVWRLLNDSPTKDWPLAFCDWRTIDKSGDIIANDVVFDTSIGENHYLRHNSDHRWWYLAAQRPEEVVVFRNVSIGDPTAARAFHCAFRNTQSDPGQMPRESVEVRLAAFY